MSRLPGAIALLVLLVVSAGCQDRSGLIDLDRDGRVRVVCMGDSNTASNARFDDAAGWCSILGQLFERPGWTTVGRGRNGGSAACGLKAFGQPLPCLRHSLADVLASDAPDAIILAYGTNDALYGAPLDKTIAALRAAVATADALGIPTWVALVPPLAGPAAAANPRVDAINRRILRSFERTIDFHSPMRFPQDFWEDGIHVDGVLHPGVTGATGQGKRAQAALAVLEATRGVTGPPESATPARP